MPANVDLRSRFAVLGLAIAACGPSTSPAQQPVTSSDAGTDSGGHVVVGGGDAAAACTGRLNQAALPVLTDAILECVNGMGRPAVASAPNREAYVSFYAFDSIAQQTFANLFTIHKDAVEVEHLRLGTTWVRTDRTGAPYLFKYGGGGQDGVYTRAGSEWRFDAPSPPKGTWSGMHDADVTPEGMPLMVLSSGGETESLALFSRGSAGWSSEAIGMGVGFPFAGNPPAAVGVGADGGARVVFWRTGGEEGLYEWRSGQPARLLRSGIPRQANLHTVRPAGSGAAVSVSFPDGIHVLIGDDAAPLVDVVVPGTTPSVHACADAVLEPMAGICPQNCTDATDGSPPDVSALARTVDGRYWIAYIAGHLEREFKYDYACGEGPCACQARVVRDDSRVKLTVARVDKEGATPVQVVWQTDIDVVWQTHAAPYGIDLDGRGSELHLAAGDAPSDGKQSWRYWLLDTTAFVP